MVQVSSWARCWLTIIATGTVMGSITMLTGGMTTMAHMVVLMEIGTSTVILIETWIAIATPLVIAPAIGPGIEAGRT